MKSRVQVLVNFAIEADDKSLVQEAVRLAREGCTGRAHYCTGGTGRNFQYKITSARVAEPTYTELMKLLRTAYAFIEAGETDLAMSRWVDRVKAIIE